MTQEAAKARGEEAVEIIADIKASKDLITQLERMVSAAPKYDDDWIRAIRAEKKHIKQMQAKLGDLYALSF